jgi:hypothetical protein
MNARCCARVVLLTASVVALPAAAVTVPVAAGGRVQVLQSNVISPRARRCVTRLREELTAGGFQVAISEFGAGGDALWMVDPPSPRDGSLATITLIGNPDEGPAELWIVDGVAGGRAAVRRLLVPAGSTTHDDEVLAIRTLEFLRASALELARGGTAIPVSTPTPTPAPPSSALPPSVVAPEPPRPAVPLGPDGAPGALSFELGLSLFETSRSLGPAFLPLARLRAELVSVLETRITLAGLGTRPQVTKPEGTASVDHTFGLVELRTTFRQGRAVRPAVGLGGGVLLVQVDGAGNGPYEGRRGHAWAGLFDLSAGLTLAVGRRIALAVEAHGQVAGPSPTVQFYGREAARIGRPALLTSLTLVTPL